MPKVIKRLGQPTQHLAWYEINGMEFYQDALCLGQSLRLAPLVQGVSLDGLDPQQVLSVVSDRIGEVLEIILIPKRLTQEQHIMELETPGKVERAHMFLMHVTHLDLVSIVEDFFVCNLDGSFMPRVLKIIQEIFQAPMKEQPSEAPETTTNGSLPCSPEATPLIEPASLAANSMS